ncbi:MAG: mechanosensitive ion channel [Gammaproteobacteria bacterium]|nr:mechanosensitive ion channel [Gammaproteobacteria bacterium]
MIRNQPFWSALCASLLLLACAGAGAQPEMSREAFEQRLAEWNFLIRQAETELIKRGATPATLESIRRDVEKIQKETSEVIRSQSANAGETRSLLGALGDPPAEGEPPEEQSVADRRRDLQERLAMFEARVKEAELAAQRAKFLLERQAARERARLAEELFARNRSPVSWSVLSSAGPHFVSALAQLARAPVEAWLPALTSESGQRTVPALVLAVILAFGFGWPLRIWLLKRYVRNREVPDPPYRHKVIGAVMIGIGRGVLPALLAAAPLAVLLARGSGRGIAGDMMVAALIGTIAVVLTSGLARAALAPASPSGWRLTPLRDRSAQALYRRIRQVMLVAAVFFFIEYPARRHLYISEELGIFYNFLGDSVIAVLILALLPRRLWRTIPQPGRESGGAGSIDFKIQLLRVVVAIAAITIPVSSVFGYTAFASYLTENLLITGVVVGGFIIFHGLAREVLTLILERRDAEDVDEEDSGSGMLRFWLVAAFDFGLFVVGAMVLLWAWGFGLADFRAWLAALMTGVKIGSFTLALNDVLIAVAIFVAILFLTRTLQRFLEERLLPQTRLDVGLRHSLKTATGYAGLVIAAAVAFSALGLDLSNLAIIAGALSVGIGFGLQNVVNNFVSGLILLVERPVKVGDWVVVGPNEGYVQRINVRATEIQTFQRSSVIIPNSELLSSSVINWTHRDTNARVDINIGVAYGSDIDTVRDTLLECARAHPNTSSEPEPFVLFLDFGESSLDFGLRFYISHADQSFRTASDVRFAIVKAFGEKGIQIPFPQRDLHLKTVDGGAWPELPARDPSRGKDDEN